MVKVQNIFSKIKKGYAKNYREYIALRQKLYPEFVFEKNPITIKDEIPVFTLHSVNPARFEEQLIYLSSNGYQTLVGDGLYDCLVGNKPISERSIVLTFDDGWKNLHTVVYPLLKKYKFTAICFLISGLIPEVSDRANASEHNPLNENASAIPDSKILCNWEEVREMHQSGLIDFQSHSMYHYLIFTSPKIVDFIHPQFDSYAMNLDVPLIRINGKENFERMVKLGTPIYEHSSRFSGRRKYYDDENLRNECTEFAASNGGNKFFDRSDWRRKLLNIVKSHRLQNNDFGSFEAENSTRESIFNEFRESKLSIESKLPGKRVNHFCYPWWEGSELASVISKEAGYLTNFWGVIPKRNTNRKGDDPYKISRILSDDYIFRLPGNGRKSNIKILQEKLLQNKNFLKKISS